MTRVQGMGLMGTEGPPDETVMFGAFADGIGQASPSGVDTPPSPLLGPDEASRFAASAPKPDSRFHYRAIAADRALAAADLLPQRSQAYAATLCWAARYAKASGDQDKAGDLSTLRVDRRLPGLGEELWRHLSAARFRGGEDLLAAAHHDLGEADGRLGLAARRVARRRWPSCSALRGLGRRTLLVGRS